MNAHIDISAALLSKSDQLNAEDLLAGPRTIRITNVSKVVEKDKDGRRVDKIWIEYDGGEGRPWKLSKTAARMLAACWGNDAGRWIGLSCTVYNDESVVFGGQKTGGIRVSHVEGITAPRTLNLTVTRGKKKEYTIQPLTVEKKTKADAWRERLMAVASDPTKAVAEAWAKVPDAIKAELGAGLFEQLEGIEKAAAEHATSDDVVLDDLNKAITGEE